MAKNKRSKDVKYAIIGCALVMAISVTSILGVSAYLTDDTNEFTNYFSPLTFTNIKIDEPNGNLYDIANINNKVARIANPDNHNVKPVYIRAAVVTVVRGENGVNLNDKYNYTSSFTLGSSWIKGSDGYYYYRKPVLPGSKTTDLFNEKGVTIKDGTSTLTELPDDVYSVEVQVIADAVQAVEDDGEPIKALNQQWSISTQPASNAWGSAMINKLNATIS